MISNNSGFHKKVRTGLTKGPGREHHEFGSTIAPTIRWIAAQYRSQLRQALGPEGVEAMAKLSDAASDIEATVARGVEAKLPELVREEVRRHFEDALRVTEAWMSAPSVAEVDDWDASGTRIQVLGAQEDQAEATLGLGEPNTIILRGPSAPTVPEAYGGAGGSAKFEVEAGLYEGTIRLALETDWDIGKIVRFVRELSREPEIRLLKLVSSRQDGVDVLLGLRKPLNLNELLPRINGVTQVSALPPPSQSGYEQTIVVRLDNSPNQAQAGPVLAAKPSLMPI